MIEVNALTKRYGRKFAVQNVSFRCVPGTITGFLGPNGAGKSTTLKMICGLVRPTSGESTVLGRDYLALENPGDLVGTLIDPSALDTGRSGRETLALSARLIGTPANRRQEMFDLVGLDRRAAKRNVHKYSLGMRQRLGIAQAMLGDPDVLILDEPANGLDPQGIRWMRELLRGFADRGGTVLLSSHLLSEVELIADQLAIINHGQIVAVGTTGELLSGSAGPQTVVRIANPGEIAGLVSELDARSLKIDEDTPEAVGGLVVNAEPVAVGAAALAAGVALAELRPMTRSGHLEDLFMQLTGEPTDGAHREAMTQAQ